MITEKASFLTNVINQEFEKDSKEFKRYNRVLLLEKLINDTDFYTVDVSIKAKNGQSSKSWNIIIVKDNGKYSIIFKVLKN